MQPTPPPWPEQQPQQPPTPGGMAPRSRLTITLGIVSVVSAVLIVALIGTLIIVLQRGVPSGVSSGEVQPGATSAQTATTSSIQATSTAEGTPVPGGTGSGGTGGAQSTPTPKPTATPALPPSVQILSNHLTGKSNSPITVTCPKGELALSGGWSSSVRSLQATYSKRSGNGWQVLVNTLNVGLIPTTTAYVACLRNAVGVTVTERQYSVRAGIQDIETKVTAQCNPGEFAFGGGMDDAGLIIWKLVGPGSNQFYADLHNLTDTAQYVTAYAECMPSAAAKIVTGQYMEATVDPGASVALQATCPASAMVVGASLDAMNDIALYDYSPRDSATWQAHVLNRAGSPQKVSLSPLCLQFS